MHISVITSLFLLDFSASIHLLKLLHLLELFLLLDVEIDHHLLLLLG
jgi:hypothetical protein